MDARRENDGAMARHSNYALFFVFSVGSFLGGRFEMRTRVPMPLKKRTASAITRMVVPSTISLHGRKKGRPPALWLNGGPTIPFTSSPEWAEP